MKVSNVEKLGKTDKFRRLKISFIITKCHCACQPQLIHKRKVCNGSTEQEEISVLLLWWRHCDLICLFLI